MHATSAFIAASSLLTIALAAPIPASPLAQRAAFTYTVYGGDGNPTQGWPAQSQWKSFDDLWAANEPVMKVSCSQFGTANNNDQEMQAIKEGITAGSATTKIPAQFILAAIMQESKGCVRAPTTNYGQENPGLMQSFNGKASCNSGAGVLNPCPTDNIKNQIAEGLGQGLTFGYQQALQQAGGSGAEKFYRAARIYNSGSVAASGNLGAGIATHCYASDMANRLMGWTTQATKCEEVSIASYQGTATAVDPDNSQGNGNGNGNADTDPPAPSAAPATPATPTAAPAAPAAPAATPSPSTNTTPAAGSANPTAPQAPGTPTNCKSWYTVKEGDTCEKTGMESALRALNQIDANCGNLWLGYAYCIEQ